MPRPHAVTFRSDGRYRSTYPDGITILGVQFASIKHLFAPIIDRTECTFIHVNDWMNELHCKLRPSAFVEVDRLANSDWHEWHMPPGWANRLAPWIMPTMAKWIGRAWRKRGWKNPRLIVTFPYFLALSRSLGSTRTIYYAVDNYQAYWPDRAASLCRQENHLIETARASIAVSSRLAGWFRERVPSAAANIHYLPNGVRPDMITPIEMAKQGPLPLDYDLAQRFGESRGPIVGHYGNLGPGIEFLTSIVARCPHFRFLLIGQALLGGKYRDNIAYLKTFPNVFMTGHLQEPAGLRFLRQCNVMLLAEPVDAQNQYSCPNRLWTFLGTGRPIVSTPIPEMIKFDELVYAAANVDAFVEALHRATQEDTPRLVSERIEIAKQHTWPLIADRLWSIVSL